MFKTVRFASKYVYQCHVEYYSKFVNSKITTHKRNDRQSKVPKVPFKNKNPGVDYTIQSLLDEGVIKSEDEVDLDLLENSHSDFFNVGKSYREHKEEMHHRKEILQKKIVKQKYFQEFTPNLLTWSEKEQIRYLHKKNPEEWSLERLADCFPVTLDTAHKIVSHTWKPSAQSRIDRHDASVLRNWKELEEGTLKGVSEKLRQQFLKFSKRNIPPRSQKDIEETLKLSAKNNMTTEFSQLIDGYRNEAEKLYQKHISSKTETLKAIESNEHETHDEITETHKNSTYSNKKTVTLESLRKTIMRHAKNNEEIALEDKYLIAPETKVNDLSNVDLDEQFLYKADTDIKLPREFKEKLEDMKAVIDYTKRIRIPKKAWKKGSTYKVNDCYYDFDGQFLYRVPGMTENFGNQTDIEEERFYDSNNQK